MGMRIDKAGCDQRATGIDDLIIVIERMRAGSDLTDLFPLDLDPGVFQLQNLSLLAAASGRRGQLPRCGNAAPRRQPRRSDGADALGGVRICGFPKE